MFKVLRRWWKYMTAKTSTTFDERADPKIQLEQAIMEAQDQHRRLIEQAASVVANQKQTEMRLNRAMEELEKVNGSARQAVLMADEATRKGDAAKAREYTQAAEAFANRLVAVEREVEGLKQLGLQSTQAADQAKAAVNQNSAALQQKLAERQKLLSQLDQAKMQEQMNRAMATLSETVGQDVPTLVEVRDKIETRYARALGQSELQGQTVESHMLEVEQAQMNTEAQARLAEIRTQLGLPAPGEPTAP
jgi:phage shock protein A